MDVIHLARALQRTAHEVLFDAFDSAQDPVFGFISYKDGQGGFMTDGASITIKVYDPPVGIRKYRIIVIEEESIR